MSAASLLPAGTVVAGEYTVVRPLDEGGMGAVYLAEQRSTGKQRALKVMHREIVADPSLQRRFEQEARVGARIPSEHVVEVLAAGVDAGTGLPYLVMELLEGEDLRHRVDERGALSHEEVRAIFEQLCHAMAAAHAAGVVHRDLKPENVFLARSRRAGGAPFTVKVLDFGIAKLAAEAGTRSTKGAVGSPLWMAPEQTAPGPVAPSADVWALGLVAYELLTGKTFWRAANEAGGTTAQLLREIVLDPIPGAGARATEQGVAGRLPVDFDAWFGRCVAREPAARFADAGQAWRAMRQLLAAPDALAETLVDPGSGPAAEASETGDATPFLAGEAAAPPVRSSALPQETPVASVQQVAPAAPRRSGRTGIVVGIAIAAAGIATGWMLSRRAPVTPATATATATATGSAPATESASASAPASAPATAPAPAPAPAPTPAPTPSTATALPRSSARPSLPGGFTDPPSPNGPTQWKVQDHHVRLLSRLVSNDGNVADATVRKAIEWDSWQYLQCYERSFAGARDLAEGTVTIAFDILGQLPRNARLQSSTFASATFNDCVLGTLVGQTINAAGPDGTGHVVEAFRFVPMN